MAAGLFDCTGKVTVVTGGNGGIGLGFAMGVAKMGGDIAIWARNAQKSAAAKADLEAAGAGKVIAYQIDVSEEQNIVTGFETVMADFGQVDCVFANSGASPRYNSVFDMPTEHWYQFQRTALHGAFFTLREGARHMKARVEAGDRSGGSLVACGSLSLFQGLAGKIEYASSKAAIAAAVRCLAIELAPLGIRANVVAPGLVITPMMGGGEQARQVEAHFAPTIPMKRTGFPADFEGIGAYLCSDASSFMTGETITIDGGYMVRP
ncbi:NAD(P)-dependent dehydrogenase (short-subunit alcohol dehydrogenase family) [Novosphingobium chloroacetimidivorans]|uniref:NAD(P)-dependent dehydrogenase (Short-subunit alcohol dehydrogenase family) n=1 Tax=Novosphingobium chloroacetimidivorans TaxID=1428314 RepID=A0A7W7NX94_9SPHN|nr:SDR family oxidoreductase [Novosphingobium chloroacetimidivorans]MBB4860166.1 NAD(P)-dependent dehydrogenase (short-subunit alcohol dehydrogenase family) [Novosphingobium chloroacetimidivorans]